MVDIKYVFTPIRRSVITVMQSACVHAALYTGARLAVRLRMAHCSPPGLVAAGDANGAAQHRGACNVFEDLRNVIKSRMCASTPTQRSTHAANEQSTKQDEVQQASVFCPNTIPAVVPKRLAMVPPAAPAPAMPSVLPPSVTAEPRPAAIAGAARPPVKCGIRSRLRRTPH